jgi:hypothetical protein
MQSSLRRLTDAGGSGAFSGNLAAASLSVALAAAQHGGVGAHFSIAMLHVITCLLKLHRMKEQLTLSAARKGKVF